MSVAGVERKRSMTTATKTFRGRTLEEVLPQIKADLGPDAEIVRQREGLTGGVGGFFQRTCIEVDARPGEEVVEEPVSRRFDAYDDEQPDFEPDPLPDEATSEGLTSPGIQEILRQAVPFADHLEIAASRVEPEPETVAEPARFEPAQPPLAIPTQPTAGARPKAVAGAIETQLTE